MWSPTDRRVVCPACGEILAQSAAREYDKIGDPWTRDNKTFEYFCVPCHDALSHHDRRSLETLLIDCNAGSCSNHEFFARYYQLVRDRFGQVGEQ